MTTKAGPLSADRLKSFVERVEKLEEERKAIGGDIRDVYSEAKGVGYDTKTIRFVVQERRLDAADRAERDTLRDVYMHALGMAVAAVSNGEMSLRQAAKAHGVSKSTLQRAVPRNAGQNEIPENASDVRALAVPAVSQDHRDMTADDLGSFGASAIQGAATPPAVDAGLPSEPSPPARSADQVHPAPLREPTLVLGSGEGERSGTHSEEQSAPKPDLFQRITGSFAPRPPATDTRGEMPPIPDFLKRRPANAETETADP